MAQFLDYMASLKGVADRKSAVSGVIRAVNLEEKAKSKIRTLSGGQRQRAGIAQALLGDPPLMILDEPTVGLDPEERIHFRNLFSQKAQNRLVLLSTHIIEDVQSVCDRLVVMDRGRILFTGTPARLIHDAEGHVGILKEQEITPQAAETQRLHITARVNSGSGVLCRVAGRTLPPGALLTEPTLEDAYLYLISAKKERKPIRKRIKKRIPQEKPLTKTRYRLRGKRKRGDSK